jgi:hypothetical protein
MTRPDIAAIAFALRILLHERHRGALLRMALGAPWTGLERVAVSDDAKPRRAAWTRYRPTIRKGAGPWKDAHRVPVPRSRKAAELAFF